MDARYSHFMSFHPHREPGWRWLRAQWLVKHRKYVTRHRDDTWTGEAARYLRDLLRCQGGLPSKRLISIYPHVHAACALHDRGGSTALQIQARLLAGQSSEEIGRLTNFPLEVINAYEQLFFDVRAHLRARDWISAQAIFKGPLGEQEPLFAAVFKKYAYFGGPGVLEAFKPYLVDGKDLFDSPVDLSTPEGRLDQSARIAVAVELLPNDAANNKKMQNITLLMLELDQKRPVQLTEGPILSRNFDSWLQNQPPEPTSREAEERKQAVLEAVLQELSQTG